MTTRRNLLIAGATAAAVATLTTRQSEAEGIEPLVPPPAPLPEPLNEGIGTDSSTRLIGDKHPKNLKELKLQLSEQFKTKDLANDPVGDWLTAFDTSLDEVAAEIVCDAGERLYSPNPAVNPKLIYEPQLFDSLLRSSSSLLDRCLAYRKEMCEFEIAGVKAALDYIAYLKLYPVLQHLDDLSTQKDRAVSNYAVQQEARKQFSRGSDPLSKGFAAQSLGSAEDAKAQINREFDKQFALRQKNEMTRDAQLAIFSRYISPGSAHNYAERYQRIQSLLEQDLSEAYQKIFCAGAGIQAVLSMKTISTRSKYGKETYVLVPKFLTPSISDGSLSTWISQIMPHQSARTPDIIDALVIWTRTMMRELERLYQYETEQIISIPLNQGWSSANGQDILTNQQITDAMAVNGSGVVSFSLPPEAVPFSAGLNSIRVTGVGLTVLHSMDDAFPIEYMKGYPSGYADGDQEAKRNLATPSSEARRARLNASIRPPSQVSAFSDTYDRPPIIISNVRLQGGVSGEFEPDISNDPGIRNINPFSGTWSISLDKRSLIWYSNNSTSGNRAWVTGLILHLRIRAMPQGYGL